jgi:DNA-binding Lrp family transcriptional regulator
MELDEIDVKLLRLLQQDASMSNKALSFELNKSIAAVHERVRKLKRLGYIKKNGGNFGPPQDRHWVNLIFPGFSQGAYV